MCACGLNMQRERTVGSVSRLFGFIRAHGNNRHTVGFWVPPHPLQSNQECLHKRGKKICMTDKYIYTPKYICKKNASRQLASQVSGWKEMGLSLWTRQLVCIKNTYVHDLVNNMIFFSELAPSVVSVYTVTSHLVIDRLIVTSSNRYHASQNLHKPYRCELPNSYRMCMNSHTPPPVGLCVGMW